MKKSDLASLAREYEKHRNAKGLKSGKFATAKCNFIKAFNEYIDKTVTEKVDKLLNVAVEKLQAIEKEERGY